jgi:hypothetical protein
MDPEPKEGAPTAPSVAWVFHGVVVWFGVPDEKGAPGLGRLMC